MRPPVTRVVKSAKIRKATRTLKSKLGDSSWTPTRIAIRPKKTIVAIPTHIEIICFQFMVPPSLATENNTKEGKGKENNVKYEVLVGKLEDRRQKTDHYVLLARRDRR